MPALLPYLPIHEHKMKSPIDLFHPLVKYWFIRKYSSPTDIQEKAWPEIASGKNVLVTAPTGSGKTLTAFLWAINCFVTGKYETGKLSVLYISPLKALNNDVQKNLITPLEELRQFFETGDTAFRKIRVMTRSGDTPDDERKKILKNPPEILITTPESLNIILTSGKGRNICNHLKCVILDEIHSIAGEKRGTFLITAVDRLTLLSGEFQRIALSATVRPLETIADLVGGFTIRNDMANPAYEKRNVTIVQSSYRKTYDVNVRYPDFTVEDFSEEPIWMNLAREFRSIIDKNRSTLLFANSRRFVEKLTRLINQDENAPVAYSHHGSLSRELRFSVEQRLKEGALKSIIATNSLELGIDIGQLDRVILIQTPYRISSAIQRIGRAGHNVGETSVADIYPMTGKDFIYAATTARCIYEFDIEELHPVENPLDLLAQIIMSMTSTDTWDIDELYNFIRSSYPFRNLPKRHFELVIDMLAGKYADSRIRELSPRIYVDRIENSITAKEGTAFLLYMSGGTIPDRGVFSIRLRDSKVKIGELDEEFVWERRLGDSFPFGNQVWRVQQITHNDVIVTPEDRTISIIPFWKAEEQNRDFHYSERIGEFLERLDSLINDDSVHAVLEKEYHMDRVSATRLIEYCASEKQSLQSALPHRHHVVMENIRNATDKNDSRQIVLHTFWGGKVNKPFSIALSAYWEDEFGYPLQYYADNDSILISLPPDVKDIDIFLFVNSRNMEGHLRKKLESTGYFGSRFRENAGRALLLPKARFDNRMPLWLNRLRSKKLLDSVMKYRDFPLLLETWRTCLQDDFDLESLGIVLDEILEGTITITPVVTTHPSPFCDNIIWRQTAKYMYEDDTPRSGTSSKLGNDLIREIARSPDLRPAIPLQLIRELDGKLKRTIPGYAPDSYHELLAWVIERKVIPTSEWESLVSAVKREIPDEYDTVMREIKGRLVVIRLNPGSAEFVVPRENLPFIAKSFGIDLGHSTFFDLAGSKLDSSDVLLSIEPVQGQMITDEDKDYQFEFFSDFLSYCCTVPPDALKTMFGMDDATFISLTESLIENDVIVMDRISEPSLTYELCTVENLERLLRMTRSARRVRIDPLPLEKLQLFLATQHGLTSRSESIEGVQDALERLFFYPAPVNAWEEYLLPSRMNVYYKHWLDTLTGEFTILWLGTGTKKVSPLFADDISLAGKRDTSDNTLLDRLFSDKRAKYGFHGMLSSSGFDSATLTSTLWNLTWSGRICNDSFETYRRGYLNNFKAETAVPAHEPSRRISFSRWKATRPESGNWFIVNYPETEADDPLVIAELKKERVRLLLKRYGILFRNLLENELPSFSWKELLPTLRIMELSGEILAGYFFENIPGLQFISSDALRLLQKQLPEDAIYWINAADPVSLCGIKIDAIKKNLPHRNGTTIIVFRGSRKVVVSRSTFRKIDIFVPPDDPLLPEYFQFFREHCSRQFNPVKRIQVEEINGENPVKSSYCAAFKKAGFTAGYKVLELWR